MVHFCPKIYWKIKYLSLSVKNTENDGVLLSGYVLVDEFAIQGILAVCGKRQQT